ncbi:kunitz-type protease inhibitor 1a [Osmerus mordax]|uniref:kunitz-type protease inhibitor 1a n=1 Tax=Osmerus mordax TaxID=8014 RepID=UPI00350FD62E
MTYFPIGLSAAFVLLQLFFLGCSEAQDFGEQCLEKYKKGRENFILDADDSVNDGATFIASPKVQRYKDCVRSCCKDPKCNVAFMEGAVEEGLIKSCFLFDCLYKKEYVCRFVKKTGYISYILDTVYESHLADKVPPNEDDLPPLADAGQDRVVQPQDTLILNGVKSKDDKELASFEWHQEAGDSAAVMEKTSFDDEISVSNLTPGMYKFKLTVTDSSGQTDSTVVTVLVLTPEQSEDHCMVPMKVGPCRSSYPRWHYNAASRKCEPFTFGGCMPNANNYMTEDECKNACRGMSENHLSGRSGPLPAAKGEMCGKPCESGQFNCSNGCCLDPGLQCDSVEQCSDGSDEASCEYLNNKFKILLQIPVDEQKVRCTETPDTGNCRDSFTRWYYNPLHQKCYRFNYGGCLGNENRFDDKDTCMRTCRTVTEQDVYSRKEVFEYQNNNNKSVVAIAVLLGVAIFILLGVLCYCFLKGRSKKQPQHQRPATSQVTTMEDTQRLVYNTTTKPV